MSFTFHSRPFALDQNRVQLGLGPMAPQGLTRGAIPPSGAPLRIAISVGEHKSYNNYMVHGNL